MRLSLNFLSSNSPFSPFLGVIWDLGKHTTEFIVFARDLRAILLANIISRHGDEGVADEGRMSQLDVETPLKRSLLGTSSATR